MLQRCGEAHRRNGGIAWDVWDLGASVVVAARWIGLAAAKQESKRWCPDTTHQGALA